MHGIALQLRQDTLYNMERKFRVPQSTGEGEKWLVVSFLNEGKYPAVSQSGGYRETPTE